MGVSSIKRGPYILLGLGAAFLVLLILSDFGVLFPSENLNARIMLHLAAVFVLISSVIMIVKQRK